MKLAAKQIEGFLRQPGGCHGVLIYGPDHGLIRQRATSITKNILGAADDAFNKAELSEEQLLQDPALLSDELSALSLMGGRRLVCIRDAGDKSGAIIAEARDALSEGSYLLVTADELTPRSPLRKLFESEPQLAALPCYKDEGYGLSQLITQSLQQYGLRVNREAQDYLCARLGGDRMMILSELERIALYFGDEKQVDMPSLQRLIESDQDTSMDVVSHAFAARNGKLFCEALDQLLVTGVQPIIFIRSIDRMLARLSEMHVLMQGGKSADQAAQSMRPPLFFKDKALFAGYARKWEFQQIQRARHQLMRLEAVTKTSYDTSETLLKEGLLRLMLSKPSKAAA